MTTLSDARQINVKAPEGELLGQLAVIRDQAAAIESMVLSVLPPAPVRDAQPAIDGVGCLALAGETGALLDRTQQALGDLKKLVGRL